MSDPDLLERLQAFENSCQPASKSDSRAQPGDEFADGCYGEAGAAASNDNILVTIEKHRNEAAFGFSMERKSADVPVTTDAQGALITFRGGEAIHLMRHSHFSDPVLPAVLHQWRVMLFLDSLQDPPVHSEADKQRAYLLQLGIFGQTSPVLLPSPDKHGIVRIRRMLIFYLFSKKPTITEVFKEELQFALRAGGTTRLSPHTGRATTMPAGTQRQRRRTTQHTDAFESSGKTVAVGSCSLARLAGKQNVKNQTYVLLFEGNNGHCRLRLTLGLHRDMQVPSQYVSVVPFHDAYISQTPYCCSCPLPSEWLDCFLAAPNS